VEGQAEVVAGAPEGAIDASPKRGRKKAAPKKTDALATVDQALISAEEKEGKEALEFISKWEITEQRHMELAGELMVDLRKRKKALTEMLKSITDPIRAAEKSARDIFKPGLGYLDSAESALNKLMSSFLDKQKQERLLALQAVEASGGKADAATLVVAHGHGALEAPDALSERTEYEIKVLNIAEVPAHYTITTLNMAAVQAHAKATRGGVPIPGLEITAHTKLGFKPGRT